MALLERDWVHKRLSSNVFVAAPAIVGDQKYRTASQFPIFHEFYNDNDAGLSASGYLVEVARQANIAICHQHLGVPLGATFLVVGINWHFRRGGPFVSSCLDEFKVATVVTELVHRKGLVTKVVTENAFHDADGVFLEGGATFLISGRAIGAISPTQLLPSALPEPVETSAAQVHDPRNVLIGVPVPTADGYRCPMRVDTAHAFFFEHDIGHVPGMMLFEAAKQAAVHSALLRAQTADTDLYGDWQGGEVRFSRFADTSRRITLHCAFTANEGGPLQRWPCVVAVEQGERVLAEVSGVVAFAPQHEVVARSAILRRRATAAPPVRVSGIRGRL